MKIFKQIKDHPKYEISEDGIIRIIKNKHIKSQYIGSTGYYMISISYNNKSKPCRVHRLLAQTYISNPKNLKYINHKDGNKLNNNIDNLEWCTHLENMQHAFRLGLANNTGEKNGQSKLNTNKVIEIKKLLLKGMSQNKIAKMYNISRSCVLGIHLKRLWKHIQI